MQRTLDVLVDMVRRLLNRPSVFEFLGRTLISAGLITICVLAARIARQAVDAQITRHAMYALIESTPEFNLPPATPLPTLTPTLLPTAPPPPPPAIRISIPAIKLNVTIKEVFPIEDPLRNSPNELIWEAVSYAVGRYNTSGNPGGGRNIVLAGHNNTDGAVFRYLDKLQPGDELILYTELEEFHYTIQKKFIIPYLGVEKEGSAKLQEYAAPQSAELVTLISCWPYATNSHRIVVIAVPSHSESENDT